MKNYLFAASLALGATFTSQAAVVECVISGTPSPQQWSEQFCSSGTSSTASAVVFRLKASKPIAEVTWTHFSEHDGYWNCRNGEYCRFSNRTVSGNGSAQACARRVLYKDGTWESLNSCAYGMYWYGSPVFSRSFDVDVTEEQLMSGEIIQ